MYKTNAVNKTSIQVRNVTEGETIEEKMRRVVNNSEPITDGAPLVYTDRKDGVLPQYDIRTDRWDVAIDAMDKVKHFLLFRKEVLSLSNRDLERLVIIKVLLHKTQHC